MGEHTYDDSSSIISKISAIWSEFSSLSSHSSIPLPPEVQQQAVTAIAKELATKAQLKDAILAALQSMTTNDFLRRFTRVMRSFSHNIQKAANVKMEKDAAIFVRSFASAIAMSALDIVQGKKAIQNEESLRQLRDHVNQRFMEKQRLERFLNESNLSCTQKLEKLPDMGRILEKGHEEDENIPTDVHERESEDSESESSDSQEGSEDFIAALSTDEDPRILNQMIAFVTTGSLLEKLIEDTKDILSTEYISRTSNWVSYRSVR